MSREICRWHATALFVKLSPSCLHLCGEKVQGSMGLRKYSWGFIGRGWWKDLSDDIAISDWTTFCESYDIFFFGIVRLNLLVPPRHRRSKTWRVLTSKQFEFSWGSKLQLFLPSVSRFRPKIQSRSSRSLDDACALPCNRALAHPGFFKLACV